MDRDAGVITARDLAQATQTLLADTYVRSLSGASVLELCLVVAASRLHRFRRMPRFNFNHLENELRAMSANDFLGDAGRARGPVLVRAFEGLRALGLVEAAGGGARGARGEGVGGGRGRGGARGGRVRGFGGSGGAGRGGRRFRACRLLVTDEEVEVAVEKHPQKPAGLKDLLTHEGVRMATTGV